MCTKILKKESSSRALAFVLLMFMMPLGFIGSTQSCGAMEKVVDEKKPLLGRADASINGDARDVEQGGGGLTSGVVQSGDSLAEIRVAPHLLEKAFFSNLAVINVAPELLIKPNTLSLEEIKVVAAWLKEPNPQAAEEEMDKINHYLVYISSEADRPEIIQLAKEKGIYVENEAEFRRILFQRAKAATENGPLSEYLSGVFLKIKRLQAVVPKYQNQNGQLSKAIEGLLVKVESLQHVLPQFQKQNDQLRQGIEGALAVVSGLQEVVPVFQGRIGLLDKKLLEKDEESKRIQTQQANEIIRLQTVNCRLWIAMTVFGVSSVAAVLLTHFYWR